MIHNNNIKKRHQKYKKYNKKKIKMIPYKIIKQMKYLMKIKKRMPKNY